jgi:hypothetical protein
MLPVRLLYLFLDQLTDPTIMHARPDEGRRLWLMHHPFAPSYDFAL